MRIRIQDQDSGSGFRIRIQDQGSGSGFRIRVGRATAAVRRDSGTVRPGRGFGGLRRHNLGYPRARSHALWATIAGPRDLHPRRIAGGRAGSSPVVGPGHRRWSGRVIAGGRAGSSPVVEAGRRRWSGQVVAGGRPGGWNGSAAAGRARVVRESPEGHAPESRPHTRRLDPNPNPNPNPNRSPHPRPPFNSPPKHPLSNRVATPGPPPRGRGRPGPCHEGARAVGADTGDASDRRSDGRT